MENLFVYGSHGFILEHCKIIAQIFHFSLPNLEAVTIVGII